MGKKGFFTTKVIILIIAIAVSSFIIIDFFGCTLKEGVPMDTINPNDFIYGEATPFFCTISDFLDSQDMGIIIDEYIFGGTEIADLFEIPFNEIIEEIVIEDPNGQIGEGDPDDILIDEEQFEDLEMLQNQTDTTDPLIGDNVTEILPPEEDPAPEEITPMLVDIIFITQVTKIATDGTQEVETTEFQFIPLELFVEDTTNKDFSDGRFITVLKLKSEPNIFIEGDGTFEVIIGNDTMSKQITPIRFSGMTDSNGELPVNFVSPTGLESQDFIQGVAPIIPQIDPRGLTLLEYKIKDVVATAFDVDYTVSEGTVFSFNFFRDVNQILVIDSQGQEVRGFPTDDQLSIGALDGSVKLSRCYKHSRTSCWMTSVYYSPIGSATIASIKVTNSNGDILFQNLSPFTSTYIINKELITRNDNYTVNYGRISGAGSSIPAGSFTFSTPEEQKNFSYRCTIAQASVAIGGGFCRNCLIPSGSAYLTCNFPAN
jgi:hypothetical protein